MLRLNKDDFVQMVDELYVGIVLDTGEQVCNGYTWDYWVKVDWIDKIPEYKKRRYERVYQWKASIKLITEAEARKYTSEFRFWKEYNK